MRTFRPVFTFTFLSILVMLCSNALFHQSRAAREDDSAGKSAIDKREAAYRANNIGAALLEQYKAKEAVESFSRALELKPELLIARINLSIALYYLPDADGAKREAEKTLKQDPNAPQPHYILGLIARAENRFDEAIIEFQKVLKIDPDDVGSNINVGQILAQQKKSSEAIAAFRRAIKSEPYNETALYNLALLVTRSGQKEDGRRLLQKFQELKQSGAGTTLGTNYLEGGRYAEAVVSTGAEAELVDKRTPDVIFSDATDADLPPFRNLKIPQSQILGQSGGDAALSDFDSDGDLDLIEVAGGSQRMLRNDGGKFLDVTEQSGDLANDVDGVAMAVVTGDLDNDGRADLFVLRYGKSSFFHNDGSGRFSDITSAAKIPSYNYLARSVALVDYDHDGDLDIFIGGGSDPTDALKFEKNLSERPPNALFEFDLQLPAAPGMLLRNNGDGTFADQTTVAKLSAPMEAFAVVPTDYDNRRDVDLLVASRNQVALWRNMRDGTFQNVADEVGLSSKQLKLMSSIAVGDMNKDGYSDFYFAMHEWAGYFAMSDGKGHFQVRRGPGEITIEPNWPSAKYNNASQLIDYDNDGLLDLVTVVTSSSPVTMQLRIWRNVGDDWVEVGGKWVSSIRAAVPSLTKGPGRRLLVAGDIDGDGDTDLIFGTIAGGLKLARNDGGNRNNSIAVNLRGRVSNKSAVEAKVEMRAGSLWQKLETYSASPAPAPADLIFGLGKRHRPDAVRIIWPAGIVQAETEFPVQKGTPNLISLNITELDRKPSSCPYLYTWNGARFDFVTDFMGGGEMGYLEEPGRYNKPDPVEYVRIRSDQLKERDGRYELRVTNELEEAMFVDRLQLLVIAHPIGTEVFPNEGMTDPPKEFRLFLIRNASVPIGAVDDHGNDELDRISKLDRRYPDNFGRDRIRGYGDNHSLTLKLTEPASSERAESRVILLLTGWTDYAWSSDNLAASQSKKAMKLPALQVKDEKGIWRTVIEDIGIPVGRPQTVTVDLTGKFLSADREVRIVTNMRIYWDQIVVDTSDGKSPMKIMPLDPVRADLWWRGFSHEVNPDDKEPFGYDYDRVSFTSPWKVMTGRYTREGDVGELLLKSDDMFVICRPGDEINLSFDAASLPPLPVNWTQTFLLYADGFSKEMDINSASPERVTPLPFHGMSRYPYAWPEQYPWTRERQEYFEKYNTRIVTSSVPSIDTAVLRKVVRRFH